MPAEALSCYTTNLKEHLRLTDPAAERRLAAGFTLSVRRDGLDDTLAFSHHERVAPDFGYRGARRWEDAVSALRGEFARRGDVLVVANCRNLPWSPSHLVRDVPHWLRLAARDGGRWLVVDDFDALLPEGHQSPHRGWADEGELRVLLAPLPGLDTVLHQRDVYALGGGPAWVPDPGSHRWLEHGAGRFDPCPGRWVRGTAASLALLRDLLACEPRALVRYAEDLWAAARHHQYLHRAEPATAAAWGELSRSLRYAAQSAARGRPRASLVRTAFDRILTALGPPEAAARPAAVSAGAAW
ncbi:hypothetical protein ACWDZX_00640 [Streptomyces collinus]|uniref:Uncharacterized protein n=1 Tax=Streptomyces collinus (strain DSM 40733 / Tue 365) TaxID=1214242 RepID=S5VEX5_STRC3|nr:hypothetical protein [Streptomyces collinus]AGS66935.1 hypothetical protein B446_00475 [Streptomyces collinus Tu 365]AGS73759.1 hypothetical protein B446_34815 [Streptomyces collinus Tu 365]